MRHFFKSVMHICRLIFYRGPFCTSRLLLYVWIYLTVFLFAPAAFAQHRVCITGNHPDFGHLQGPEGDEHTDYTVKFYMTVDGKEVKTWTEPVRAMGRRSWLGYDYNECFDFNCQENKSAQLPKNLPEKLAPKVERQLRKICECQTDRKKACPAIDRAAEKAVSFIKADSPYKGKSEFGKFKNDLLEELNRVHRTICEDDNKKAIVSLEKIIEDVEALDTSEAAEGYENRYRYLFKTEEDLLALKEKIGCVNPCGKRTRKKTAADDEAIEEVKSHIKGQIKQIKDDILEESAKIEPGGTTDKLNKLNGRLNRLQRLLGAWEQVKAATCVPDELMTNTRRYLRELQNSPGLTQDECNDLCSELGKWVRELTGENIHEETTNINCLELCN